MTGEAKTAPHSRHFADLAREPLRAPSFSYLPCFLLIFGNVSMRLTPVAGCLRDLGGTWFFRDEFFK